MHSRAIRHRGNNPASGRRSSRAPVLLCSGLLALTLGLAACGGGGGGGSGQTTPPPPANSAPTAEAGDAQTVASGDLVTLDGGASTDSDGVIASYAWVQTDGPTVSLDGSDTAAASFTAPEVSADTDLVFGLTVTDDDGDDATDSIVVTVIAPLGSIEVEVSGRLIVPASQSLDGDTNDPFNPLISNDDPDQPQPIPNPTTLGGYVNEPGAGAEGRSRAAGDREDYFLVELLEGQSLDLLVAEFQDADADLYLYTPQGILVDFSAATGERETVIAPRDGAFVVNVSIFSGATNYTLTIGSSLAPVSSRLHSVVAGQAIIRLRPYAEFEERRRALAQQMRVRSIGGGSRRARLLALDDVSVDPVSSGSRFGAQRYRRAQFKDPERARLWDTLISIKQLARRPEVLSAEPNYRVYPLASVNDELYNLQWHYPLINLPGAWDTTTGSADVIVAVVDTGVLGGHPDLAGQLVPGYDFISDPRDSGDGDGIDPDPEETTGDGNVDAVSFHGTHVTGTIAAAGDNQIGVAGVAYGARVMPLRGLADSGGTVFDINQAIRYAAGLPNDSGTVPEQAADIINLSIGGSGFSPSSQALYNELRELGITVVAAAGNESTTAPSYPASYDNVFSVSAVDVQQNITVYSNTGPTVDIAAPGGDGGRDLNGDGYPDGVLSTGGSEGRFTFTFLSGTSMAAPHVAGVFALMKSVNANLTADDFERLLMAGALTEDLGATGRDDAYGYGLINARKAIEAAINEGGGSSDLPPRLASSTLALNFGATTTSLGLTLRNSGGGSLQNVILEAQEPWLVVTPTDTDAEGLGRYRVRVARDELSPGIYEGTLRASSSANDLELRALVSVTDAQNSNLGQVYLLLVAPDSDTAVVQTLGEPDGNNYRFNFPRVPTGRYQIFAGTDFDNDLFICDAGEACGAYLTIDQPLTVTIDADRDDLDFPIEYFISLPGTASAESGKIEARPQLKRE